MNFAREGLAFIIVAALIAAAAYAAALTRRSWPLWLLAFVAHARRAVGRVLLPRPRAHRRARRPADHRAGRRQGRHDHGSRRADVRARSRDAGVDLHERLQRPREPVSGVGHREVRPPEPGQVPQRRRRGIESRERADVGRARGGRARILVRQIAGLIARRIHTYSREGERVEQGERMGIIRFGSRVDVFVPPASKVRVKVGDSSPSPAQPSSRSCQRNERARAFAGPKSGGRSCCCLTASRCSICSAVSTPWCWRRVAASAPRRSSSCSAASPTRSTVASRVRRAPAVGSARSSTPSSMPSRSGSRPALIMFFAALKTDGNDWIYVFIFASCAVIRLARFNVEQAGRAKTHFHGLPSPAAGMTLATYYWFSQTSLYNDTVIFFTDNRTLAELPWHTILRWLMVGLAYLMISDVPYPAVPTIGYRSTRQIVGTSHRRRQHSRAHLPSPRVYLSRIGSLRAVRCGEVGGSRLPRSCSRPTVGIPRGRSRCRSNAR